MYTRRFDVNVGGKGVIDLMISMQYTDLGVTLSDFLWNN